MKTIQIVVDDDLLHLADEEARRERINRSELFRTALREHLKRRRISELEEQERLGYERQPLKRCEGEVWDQVAEWPDDRVVAT